MSVTKIKCLGIFLLFCSVLYSQDVEKMGKKELRVAFTELNRQVDSLKNELIKNGNEKDALNKNLSELSVNNNSLKSKIEDLESKEKEYKNKIDLIENQIKKLSQQGITKNTFSKSDFEQLIRKTLIDKYLVGKKFSLTYCFNTTHQGQSSTIALINDEYNKEEYKSVQNVNGDWGKGTTTFKKSDLQDVNDYKYWSFEVDSKYNYIYRTKYKNEEFNDNEKGEINIKDEDGEEIFIENTDSSYIPKISVIFDKDIIKIPLRGGSVLDHNVIWLQIGNTEFEYNNKRYFCPISIVVYGKNSLQIFSDNSSHHIKY